MLFVLIRIFYIQRTRWLDGDLNPGRDQEDPYRDLVRLSNSLPHSAPGVMIGPEQSAKSDGL